MPHSSSEEHNSENDGWQGEPQLTLVLNHCGDTALATILR